MRKTALAAMALACWGLASATDTASAPLWLRNAAIAPDGANIAFTYQGDIFTVPVGGGQARQLTSNKAYDTAPVWSPDGATIVFASDREGSFDLYAIPAQGGTARRLTTHSGSEKPLGFASDSTVLYSANVLPAQKAAQGGFQGQVYEVGIDGGRPHLYASVPMGYGSVDAQGRLLYSDRKGYEDPLRKHERSAGTSDIWLVDGGRYTKLTTFDGHDLNPVWASADEYYYISEQDGTLNVYVRTLQGAERQLTNHKRHPVRSLTAATDGTLAYSWDGEIYTLRPGGEPQRVAVEIITDNYDGDVVKGYRSSGVADFVVAPKGDQVAFLIRGDIYATDVKYETTKRITDTDGQERSMSFSPDGRKLVYDSERDGLWRLYIAKIDNGDDATMPYASSVSETLLYEGPEGKPVQQPVFSPDGKKVAFLYDRNEIQVIDVDSKAVNTALDGKYNASYSDGDVTFSWSPDSRWLLASYIGVGGWNNIDVALVSVDGKEVIDLTESGYADNNPKWVLDGKGVAYTSGRYGYRSHGSWGEEEDVILMVLDGEAWDDFNMTEEEADLKEKADEKAKEKAQEAEKDKKSKKKGKKGDEADDAVKPLKFDTANRHYRTKRLTANSSHMADYWLSKKGDKLYYIAQGTNDDADLMVRDLKKGDTKVLVPGIGMSEIQADQEGKNLFALSDDAIVKVSVDDGEPKGVQFDAPYSRHPSAEKASMYDHVVLQVADKFYDTDLHGVDWTGYAADYRRFLPYINNNYDFAELLSELLGELNASHTGARYYAPAAKMSVASLGAFFDEEYDGDGLRVTEVIARGPLSTQAANIQPGDIITSIDGSDVKAGQDYYPLLEGKAGKKVRLGVKRASGDTDQVTVKPVASVSELLYQRWVEHNERVVDSISGGKIGYVHVQGMDSPSFRAVYSKLLGKYRNCDAVVVDTRYNGGGWLHNDIALLLSGKEYVRYSPRGKYIGSDPFSQWTKPSVMLVNESNYSDAHGTPYVYQTLGIGKVVGAPVPGTMTAVWWENLIDSSMLFGIPEVTSLDRDGKPLENHQLNPDIPVYNNPGDVQQGIDTQLIEAVRSLMK